MSTNVVRVAESALWVLCRLGQAGRWRSYILHSLDPGFEWDHGRDVGAKALSGMGWHLRTHEDLEFARVLISWAPSEDTGLPDMARPPGVSEIKFELLQRDASMAMAMAVGIDPKALLDYDPLPDNDALRVAGVQRFLAERQDG